MLDTYRVSLKTLDAMAECNSDIAVRPMCSACRSFHRCNCGACPLDGYRTGLQLFDNVDESGQRAGMLASAGLHDADQLRPGRRKVADDQTDTDTVDEQVNAEAAAGRVTQ
jgi:hypothetical protein